MSNSIFQSKAAAALMYAEAGLFIFPVRRSDKKPAVKGYRQLRWGPAEVKAHWARHPNDNIGCDGEANGLVFLDVDAYKEGVSEHFETLHADVRATKADQFTPSGGWHKIYRADAVVSYKKDLGAGIDIKYRGYILLAPSDFGTGPYELTSAWFWSGYDKLPLAPQVMVRGSATGASTSLSAALNKAMKEGKAAVRGPGMIRVLEAAANPADLGREEWLKVGMAMRDAYVGTRWDAEAFEAWEDWSCDWRGASDDDVDKLVEEARKVWPDEMAEAHRLVDEGRSKGQAVGIPTFKLIMEQCGVGAEAFDKLMRGDNDKAPEGLGEVEEAPASWSWQAMPSPRQWLIKSKVWRGKVTVISGPGGVGKSSYAAGLAIDAVLGKATVLRDEVHEPLRVLIWNGEDDREETARKVHALLKQHEIDPADLGDRLHIHDSRSLRLDALHYLFEKAEERTDAEERSLKQLDEQLLEIDADLIIVDPLVALHGADENSNSAMESVMDALRDALAQGENRERAVVVVHHTKKLPSDLEQLDPADMARGASAINAAARAHYMLRHLTEKEAARSRLPPANRRSYITVIDAKNNLARLKAGDNTFQLLGVFLDNGDEDYPEGDNVGAISAYTAVDTFHPHELAMTVVLAMAAERGEEKRWWAKAAQSGQWVGHYIRELVDPKLEGDETDRTATVKSLIDYMVAHGLLIARYAPHPDRSDRSLPGYGLAADAELKADSLRQSETVEGEQEVSR